MFKILVWAIYVVNLAVDDVQASTPESPFYIAGVVEYSRSTHEDFFERIDENLAQYVQFIEDAADQEVDILVFPEETLNGGIPNRDVAEKLSEVVPDPIKKEVPCEGSYIGVLQELSCAARDKNIYLVVNLSEQSKCNETTQNAANDTRPCASDGLNFYNTAVVLDRNGAIIARYRKYNLFGDTFLNHTKTAEHVTFETDFGVFFGIFTSFDIMFNEPALSLVRDGIKDFVHQAMWISGMPFVTGLQIQEYWSYANDVNLLASGGSNPAGGSGGSGIYAGIMGALTNYISIPGRNNNKLLVSQIRKLNGLEGDPSVDIDTSNNIHASQDAVSMDKFFTLRDHIDNFTSEVIGENYKKELCSGELCCTFNVTSRFLDKTADKDSYYEYRAIVGDIVRPFAGGKKGGIKACGIVACSGSDFKLCARRFNDSSKVGNLQVFHRIHVEGSFPAIDEVLTMPDTLIHALRPLRSGSFIYKEDKKEGDEKKLVSIHLRWPLVNDLQTFGIYGRDFRKDEFGANGSSLNTSNTSILLVLIIYIICNIDI